jgi:hypothetical protein
VSRPERRIDYDLKMDLEAIVWEDVEWIGEVHDRDKPYPVVKLGVP